MVGTTFGCGYFGGLDTSSPFTYGYMRGAVDSSPLNDTLRDPMSILNVERNGDVFPVILSKNITVTVTKEDWQRSFVYNET